ncbi:MAG: CBS domain-containing protein [Candidatus Bipolaricaulota bacterium]|nr:CBS domain-containing protein [Candidatus Bipolaricaulota bacterium]
MLVKEFLQENPASALEGRSVLETKELMEENNFRIIFVVDEEDELVGFLTYDSIKEKSGDQPIDNFVSRSTLHAEETDTIDKAVSIIREYSLMVLPVVDSDRKLVGVLTPGKLFEKFSDLLNFGEGGFWITLSCEGPGDVQKILTVLDEEGVDLLSLLNAGENGDKELVMKVGEVEDAEGLKRSLMEVL